MELIEAASRGDNVAVNRQLQQGVDVTFEDENGRTALSWAAEAGYNEVVRKLLPAPNIDVNSRDCKNGWNPLQWAEDGNHKDVIASLLTAKGIDLSFQGSWGETPVLYAVAFGKPEVLEAILCPQMENTTTHRPDIDKKDTKSGLTPLRIAIRNKSERIIELLLQSSASKEGITREDWLQAFGSEASTDTVIISETSVRFISDISISLERFFSKEFYDLTGEKYLV